MLDRAGDVTDLSRAAGRGKDVEIRRQRDIAGQSRQTLFRPARSASVSTSPMTMVYLPAGKCAMVTVKFVPLISSRNAAALLVAPSMATDASSLRCAKSPLTLTCLSAGGADFVGRKRGGNGQPQARDAPEGHDCQRPGSIEGGFLESRLQLKFGFLWQRRAGCTRKVCVIVWRAGGRRRSPSV